MRVRRPGNVRSARDRVRPARPELTDDVAAAETGVLPVSLGRARLEGFGRRRGTRDCCATRVRQASRVLGHLHGLQLEGGDRGGGAVEGLGSAAGRAVRLQEGRVPPDRWAEVGDRRRVLFAHSYARRPRAPTAWSEEIVAEARSGSFLGDQFHSEKSALRRPYSRSRLRSAPSPDPVHRRGRRPRRPRRALPGDWATSAIPARSAPP